MLLWAVVQLLIWNSGYCLMREHLQSSCTATSLTICEASVFVQKSKLTQIGSSCMSTFWQGHSNPMRRLHLSYNRHSCSHKIHQKLWDLDGWKHCPLSMSEPAAWANGPCPLKTSPSASQRLSHPFSVSLKSSCILPPAFIGWTSPHKPKCLATCYSWPTTVKLIWGK